MSDVATKEIVPVFEADERLYRRLSSDQFEGNTVLNLAIQLPSCSVNRSKYSKPEDVLVPERPLFTRVAEMLAGDLPDDYVSSGNKTSAVYNFGVAHVPLVDNIAHSEIQVSKDGEYRKNRTFSSGVKKKLRQALAKKMRVLPQE